jgi:hypothetical protein
MEIAFASHDVHEAMMDQIYNAFFQEDKNKNDNQESVDESCGGSEKRRSRPWTPHASIAYDNPGPSPIPMEYFLSLIQRFPTLTSTQPRDIVAISLWNTAGKLEQWKCIDRIEF